MNLDQIEGKWDQIKGALRQEWAKLTEDDLEFARGSREKLAGRIQERYGVAREEALERIQKWEARH
ncbi:MAG: CsbD family protein [Alphaproteobacteria bacterium]|nr:CsbD family protein [Alphaproteobacteria bacterium]MDX5367945.1 CsbD family protein [Alphaproteobacteria bacterium]MDX5462798.1 CsbD family protein [Alphaproteobacteria bacterium]